jgi:hypothetical protein
MGHRLQLSDIGRLEASAATLAVFLLATLLPAVGAAQSPQPLPSVNLGFTSFLDGGPPAGPGFYFQQYVQYFYANEFKDVNGNEVPLLDDLHALASLSQGIYQSDQSIPLLGGKWGIDVILPFVYLNVDPAPGSPLNANKVGLGDLLIGPFIQWGPIMGKKGPIFMHRIELQNLVPVGDYDDDKVLNAGSNFYSFNPYWAATLFMMPRWKFTWRLHYLWNAENDRPLKRLFGPPGSPIPDDTKAGQAIHLNFASSFELLPKRLHVGVNGYYLKQITNTKVDGNNLHGTREQVLGIGPGAVWHFSPNDHLFANTYFEVATKNRPEGRIRLNLRWTHHF